ASHSRKIAGDQGEILGILRYGYLQLPLQLADQPEDPQFWDGFGRLDRTLSQGHGLRVNLLASGDRLSFREDTEEEKEAFRTSYQNQYLWLTDQWLPTSRLLFESRVSLSLVDTRRDVEVDLEDGSFTVADDRRLETPALAHDGYLEAGKVQHMKWGLDLRYLDVDYGYRNERNLTTPLAALRAQPAAGETVFDQGFHGSQIGAYVSDRLTWSKVSLEAGWRYDENSVTDDEYLSPRLDLSWQLGSVSRLRVAWGHFYQSQRLYELEVADGVDQFQPAERAEHRVASLQHRFDTGARRPLTLRIELYERKVENPRHRFENLADPVSKVPELEPDRVLLEPQSSRARGVELFGSGALREVDWFFSYTYSESRDRIDGKWVPRFNDQPHAFALDLRYRFGKSWDFNLALQGRSGWPITRIGVETGVGEDGEPVALPTLGPLYGERLGDYLRADLQARKRWRLRRGALELEINLINLTNRRNPRGVELDFEIEDGEAVVRRTQKTWQGLLPNLDLSWSF
ncbi:MAG: TonB-dependent receptor, partial [Acidobacteria bacterium]|nr:TonB-dependent receptor [Acidobacteriota bacterium]